MESNSSQLSLTRVRCTLPAAKCLEFTPDGSSLVVVTHEGVPHLATLDSVNLQLLKSLGPLPGYIILKMTYVNFFMVALCNRADHIYFHPVVCSFFFFLFCPCLITAVGDWMSAILPHMVWP